jgi:hypothetical protein
MAVAAGFEPAEGLHPHTLSRSETHCPTAFLTVRDALPPCAGEDPRPIADTYGWTRTEPRTTSNETRTETTPRLVVHPPTAHHVSPSHLTAPPESRSRSSPTPARPRRRPSPATRIRKADHVWRPSDDTGPTASRLASPPNLTPPRKRASHGPMRQTDPPGHQQPRPVSSRTWDRSHDIIAALTCTEATTCVDKADQVPATESGHPRRLAGGGQPDQRWTRAINERANATLRPGGFGELNRISHQTSAITRAAPSCVTSKAGPPRTKWAGWQQMPDCHFLPEYVKRGTMTRRPRQLSMLKSLTYERN